MNAEKKESFKQTADNTWTNNSKSRDRQRIAEQLSPQNAKKVIETELEKSGTVRKATDTLERVNREREERIRQEIKQRKIEPIAQSTAKAEAKPKSPDVKTGIAFWNGQPVKITGYAGTLDGKDYVHIEGTNAIIPLDEIEYPKEELREQPKKQPEDGAKDKESPETRAMREKEEKRKQLEKECKEKLEEARKKGEQEGREKLLHEIEEKKNKNIFRRFGKFIKRHKKVIIAGAVGAAIVAATWATLHSLSLYLPWNLPIKEVNNFINGVITP